MLKDDKLVNFIPERKLNEFLHDCWLRYGPGGIEDHGATMDDIREAFEDYQRFSWSVPFTGGERDFNGVQETLEYGLCLEPRYQAANDNMQLDLFDDYMGEGL